MKTVNALFRVQNAFSNEFFHATLHLPCRLFPSPTTPSPFPSTFTFSPNARKNHPKKNDFGKRRSFFGK
jgi:hypothetical protein